MQKECSNFIVKDCLAPNYLEHLDCYKKQQRLTPSRILVSPHASMSSKQIQRAKSILQGSAEDLILKGSLELSGSLFWLNACDTNIMVAVYISKPNMTIIVILLLFCNYYRITILYYQ